MSRKSGSNADHFEFTINDGISESKKSSKYSGSCQLLAYLPMSARVPSSESLSFVFKRYHRALSCFDPSSVAAIAFS